jgi:hypothetical protein
MTFPLVPTPFPLFSSRPHPISSLLGLDWVHPQPWPLIVTRVHSHHVHGAVTRHQPACLAAALPAVLAILQAAACVVCRIQYREAAPREMISRIQHGFVCWRGKRSFWRQRHGASDGSCRLVWGERDALVCGSLELEPLPRSEIALLKFVDVHLFELCEVAEAPARTRCPLRASGRGRATRTATFLT